MYYIERSLTSRIGRGTTLQAGMAIAYATLDYILERIGCRTLFATHYHELETMLKVKDEHEIVKDRKGIEYWCTDVDDAVSLVINISKVETDKGGRSCIIFVSIETWDQFQLARYRESALTCDVWDLIT